jgi:hypothetical protein
VKLYIAGPMTGYKEWNFPAFFKAEEELKSLGFDVINPAHNDGVTLEEAMESAGNPERPNNSWAWYMRRDLPHVMESDALCVLEGWQESRGATLEVHVARALGMPIMVLRDGELIPRVKAIGFSGWARSGKDTAADYAIKNYGYTKASFAEPIREALFRLNPKINVGGFSQASLATAVKSFGWEDLKTFSVDVRPLMQRLGTEVGREMFGDNFWVEAALDRIPDGAKVVFSDVRYPNEADSIKALGGQIYRINRDGVGPANGHPSETALNDYAFDGRIDNSGTVEQLYGQIDRVINANELVSESD